MSPRCACCAAHVTSQAHHAMDAALSTITSLGPSALPPPREAPGPPGSSASSSAAAGGGQQHHHPGLLPGASSVVGGDGEEGMGLMEEGEEEAMREQLHDKLLPVVLALLRVDKLSGEWVGREEALGAAGLCHHSCLPRPPHHHSCHSCLPRLPPTPSPLSRLPFPPNPPLQLRR
jgi:hypothetical protein